MKRLEEQTRHGALVLGGHDDRARQDFAFSLRNYMTQELMPSNKLVYDQRAGPSYAKRTGAAPANAKQIREAMNADSYYTFYVSARRTSQELIWGSVIPAVRSSDAPALAGQAGGTLTLDPDVVVPGYVDALDIHCMPGGYTADVGGNDLAIGAVYDRGVYLYMSGLMGGLNDAVGQLAGRWFKAQHPTFAPKAILDMGCAVGHATLPYCDLYPEAEVHGIDVGAALLRYGHVRAESLGKRVHFRQANAEASPYPDASFDLVMSHIVLHETSGRGLPAILRECYRLLRPGGYMLHIDQPSFKDLDDYQCFLQENETYYNNEPFWRQYRRIDLADVARQAGFAAGDIDTDILTAAVVQQSQNNVKVSAESEAAKKRGFSVLVARKAVG
jgi:ubiquinone/menaquinone biosynthesis C-methylase UbiE